MSTITGTWHVRMKTPIGTIDADYRFAETPDGITGTATGTGEETALDDIVCEATAEGERVMWRQEINKPMRLNLEYDVTVTGDTFAGYSRAGRLPRSRVTGERADA
ncbi:hypothetical protein [Saccharopolyspora sp. NPDC002376]